MITDNNSYLVEIDEVDLIQAAGNIHGGCRRAADRVLGKSVFKKLLKSNLVNFDYQKWHQLLKTGQAFLNAAKRATSKKKITILSWNKQHSFNTGAYCIKMILEDGSARYVKLGRKIHRFSESVIDREVDDFNHSLSVAENSDDPLGFTSTSGLFGASSQLGQELKDGEVILNVIRTEKAKYSQLLNADDTNFDNDYTPLGLLVHPGSEEFVTFGNCIPLISDPFQFEKLYQNWNDVGYQPGECALKIIESDKEFDLYLMDFFADGMQPIIDPFFKADKELMAGIYVNDIDDLTNHEQAHSYPLNPEGVWKAGDRVKVVFPDVKTDKYATGILLTDEFIDEMGELCIIFRPIEDGLVREDLKFKMPTKLLVKDYYSS